MTVKSLRRNVSVFSILFKTTKLQGMVQALLDVLMIKLLQYADDTMAMLADARFRFVNGRCHFSDT